jgi:hypothetical protein
MTTLRVQATPSADVKCYTILVHGQEVILTNESGTVESYGSPSFVKYALLGRPGGTLDFTIDNDGRIVFTARAAEIPAGASCLEVGPVYFDV